ncbi:MAG: PEGA domain-containing protein [Lachnospiraceae bacterium]|nr:PEGA domain-containing protein [Lachnospiraceae bacterium]MBP5564683.1 PEGA domain-containing protein [Lachnospiraceae bacterium]
MRNTKIKLTKIILYIAAALCLCACEQKPSPSVPIEPAGETTESSIFVYSDTCIIVETDRSTSSITFQNLETGLRYTLTYDSLTFFTDRYSKSITATQVSNGQICNISFVKDGKKLKSLEVASNYFEYTNVSGFKFYNSSTRMEYLKDKYELDDNIVVCSGKETIDVLEIADEDVITIRGNGHTVYSISVDRGHGYLSLDNDKYFIDGFIEVDKDIRKITEDMVLTVPEGKYSVLISKDGTSAVKEVTVGRNQDAVIDLSDVEIKKNFGNITFSTDPENATLIIDGEKVNDISKPVKMEYGIHEVIVRADGYETLSKYLSVGTPKAEVEFKLTKLADDETDNKDDKTTSTDTDNNTDDKKDGSETTDENKENKTGTKVYIDAPKDAELYVDGNYVGVVPCSFDKKIGTVVLTLKKDGCQTRSYTINLEDINTDSRYSFSELLKLESN